jgi:hypothetical protein
MFMRDSRFPGLVPDKRYPTSGALELFMYDLRLVNLSVRDLFTSMILAFVRIVT